MKANFQNSLLFGAVLALLGFAACDKGTSATSSNDAEGVVVDSSQNQKPKGDNERKKVTAKGIMPNGKEFPDFAPYEEFLFDKVGNQLEYISYWDGVNTHITTTRDAQGHEISRLRTANDQTGKLEYRIAWSGDFSEKIVEEFAANEGRVVSKVTTHFDSDGKMKDMFEQDFHLPDYPTSHKIEFLYDAKGNLIEEKENIEGLVVPGAKYHYSTEGNLIRVDRFDSEGGLSQTDYYDYDASGNKIEHRLQDHVGYYKTPQLEARFEYDSNGRISKEIHYKGNCTEAGQASGGCPISQTISFQYDDQGRVIQTETKRNIPTVVDMIQKFEYAKE